MTFNEGQEHLWQGTMGPQFPKLGTGRQENSSYVECSYLNPLAQFTMAQTVNSIARNVLNKAIAKVVIVLQ